MTSAFGRFVAKGLDGSIEYTDTGLMSPQPIEKQLIALQTSEYHTHWAELHNMHNATQELLDSWVERIPGTGCDCRQGYFELVARPELKPRFGLDWFRWTFDLRNAVREKLHKEPWQWDAALREWQPQQPTTYSVIAVTSISPRSVENQREALASWKRLGLSVVSVNTSKEIKKLRSEFSEVDEWIENNDLGTFYASPTQPINRLLDVATAKQKPILLINSDIRILGDQATILKVVESGKSAIGIRHNFEKHPSEATQEVWGLDAFIVWPDQVAGLPEVVFSVGRPMWDYWLAWSMLNGKRQTNWLGEPYFFHLAHQVAWSDADCTQAHEHFAKTFYPIDWGSWRKSLPFWCGE